MAKPSPVMARPTLIRFLLIFSLCVITGFILLQASFNRPAIDWFTSVLVKISAFGIRVFGGHAVAHRKVLSNPVSGFAISVEDTCNASNVIILFWAAVFGFPASWRQKIRGIVLGTLLLHATNLLRIVSLFYLGQYWSDGFEFAHVYVWEGVMMIVTLVVFWGWVERARSYQSGPVVHS